MASRSYHEVTSYTKNTPEPWDPTSNPDAHQLLVYLAKKSGDERFGAITTESIIFSDIPPLQRSQQPDHRHTNGCVLLTVTLQNQAKRWLGFIHSSLFLHLGQDERRKIIMTELALMYKLNAEARATTGHKVQWFGDFNITDGVLLLAQKEPVVKLFLQDLNLVYTQIPDFACGDLDRPPNCVYDFYEQENNIDEQPGDDGKCRVVTTLCQAAGDCTTLEAMLDPLDYQDMKHMSYRTFANSLRGRTFQQGCFDHCFGVFNVC